MTKEDAIAAYALDESRVVVIPQGVGEEFKPDRDLPRPIDEPYILYVGTLEPRKNIPLLVESFAQFRRHGFPHLLALVGPMGWMSEQVTEALARSKIADYVRLPGYVADLAPWYNHADFLVYPSSYEGFGLPPLEAMACGTPVVLPAGVSLREVAGDAALLIEPFTGEGMVNAMEALAADAGLRDRLRQKGLERASRFSWDETARRTVEVYEAVARG